VDVLNRSEFNAAVLHRTKGFRCTWFPNDTRVVCDSEVRMRASDYLVIPEIAGPKAGTLAPGVKKVIFNQNTYFTFKDYSLDLGDKQSPYSHPEVVATFIVSEDNLNYIRYAFPDVRLFAFITVLMSESSRSRRTRSRPWLLCPGRTKTTSCK
jgi:hypothetical protein